MVAIERHRPRKESQPAARTRKITVEVPDQALKDAQAYTGRGVTETVREGLERLAQIHIQNEFRKLRGKLKPALTLEEMKYDR
jgi:hypothetical protein